VEEGRVLRNFEDNGVLRRESTETAKHTEEFSDEKRTLLWLTLNEANSFINGTHFCHIDAKKSMDAVSTDNGTAWRTLN
jgi:hypothetical protein